MPVNARQVPGSSLAQIRKKLVKCTQAEILVTKMFINVIEAIKFSWSALYIT